MSPHLDDEALARLKDDISAALGERLLAASIAFGELSVEVPKAQIVSCLETLRDAPGLGFRQLSDLCGVDYPDRAERFDIVYQLLSLTANRRVRVRVRCGEGDAVPTVTGVYPCADWYEREAFDMYGVPFDGHPDLRRLLTDYGFQGHPLRKDFPMSGYLEVRFDDEQKRVVYEPVKLAEFRVFDFVSPWDGARRVLPGDEKAPSNG